MTSNKGKQYLTYTFTISQKQRELLKQLSLDRGESSSAVLRSLLDEHLFLLYSHKLTLRIDEEIMEALIDPKLLLLRSHLMQKFGTKTYYGDIIANMLPIIDGILDDLVKQWKQSNTPTVEIELDESRGAYWVGLRVKVKYDEDSESFRGKMVIRFKRS